MEIGSPLPTRWNTDQEVLAFFGPDDRKEYYLSYREFSNCLFLQPDLLRKINKGIIDVHLQYYNHVFDQVAVYKWTPVALYSLFKVARLRSTSLLFPLVWVYLFDWYFMEYFAYKEKDRQFINIRDCFRLKMIKKHNVQKKLKLANSYLQVVRQQPRGEPPMKFIGFGDHSPYIYSTLEQESKESQVYLTNLFEWYMKLKIFHIRDVAAIWKDIRSNFGEFRTWAMEKRRTKDFPCYIRKYDELLKSKYINQLKVGGVVAQLENQITNIRELVNYHLTGKFEKKNFRFRNLVTFKEDLQPIDQINICYTQRTNSADLCLYYSLIALPWLVSKLLKR